MKNKYRIVGVAHIGLPTNDLKKTIEFYKSLGFEVILETYNEKAKEKVAFLQIQNYCIESFENGQAVMADGAYQHVALDVRDIEEIKERLLSFKNYAKAAQPDVLVTLMQSFVERIYIVDENDERYCHIFIKGCTKEDYDEFFRATGYISGTKETGTITSKLHLCDSDECCKHHMVLTTPTGMF